MVLTVAESQTCDSEELIRHLAESVDGPPRVSSPQCLPFEDAFGPFESLVAARLKESCPQIPASVQRCFQVSIIKQLIDLSSRTLLAEFDRTRPAGLVFAAKLFGVPESGERARYSSFIADLVNGGWIKNLQSYPVLGRLMMLLISSEVDAAAEFCARLVCDGAALAGKFGIDTQSITGVRLHASDPHCGRRSVIIAAFKGGAHLVYKPRGLSIDNAWRDFINWFNRKSDLDLFAPAVLDCGTHGWAEFVQARQCSGTGALRRYYQRAGSLLALLYALRASDCHFDNVIAADEHPVLIDTETLLQPTLCSGAMPPAQDSGMHSVLACGMLPCWEEAEAGQPVNAGALGTTEPPTVTKAGWRYVNTDSMYFGDAVEIKLPWLCSPQGNTLSLSITEQRQLVQRGFAQAYRVLLANRSELLASNGPLIAFQDARVRVVLRNTRLYKTVLKQVVRPEYLRAEETWDHALRDALSNLPCPSSWACTSTTVAAEIRVLRKLDVPLFSVAVDGDHLMAEGVILPERAVACTPMENVRRGLPELTEQDLRCQLGLIELSFTALTRHNEGGHAGSLHWDEAKWSAEMFRTEARTIGELFLDTAVECPSGVLRWAALDRMPGIERYVVAPVDVGLWSGSAGIALFLAALFHSTGEARYAAAAHAGFAGVVRSIQVGIGIGGGSGLSSVVYALASASVWLSSPELARQALAMALKIETSRIRTDTAYDVFSGAAGAILGLSKLHAIAPDATVLAKVRECGEHLVAHQQNQKSGAAWPGRAPAPATGFAHGAAGIAYALCLAHRLLPGCGFAEAALRALEYERACYLPDQDNWLDVRSLAQPDWPKTARSWCHGAPGIGLSRVGILQAGLDRDAEADLEAALRYVRNGSPSPLDQLCCGKMASIDLLISAAAYLDRPDLLTLARRRAAGMMTDAKQSSGYRLSPAAPDRMSAPGLFTGIAGIGYQCLRLAEPELPSVLLFQ